MEKVKNFLSSAAVKAGAVAGGVASMLTVAASAEETTATITTAFQTGFQSMASDAVGMIAIIVPIALGVAGTVFLVKKAMGWFRSMAK